MSPWRWFSRFRRCLCHHRLIAWPWREEGRREVFRKLKDPKKRRFCQALIWKGPGLVQSSEGHVREKRSNSRCISLHGCHTTRATPWLLLRYRVFVQEELVLEHNNLIMCVMSVFYHILAFTQMTGNSNYRFHWNKAVLFNKTELYLRTR